VDKDLKDATDFLKEHPADFLVSRDIDGKCAKEMQLKGMPSSYIIGKNGEVAYTHVGFRPSDKDAIVKKLQEISAN
jgi:peroxiredoxin